ncbi:MAG: amidohydrolase family protein [Sphingobacterium sp.]|uniref:amidohydrolase family protein n=1 Tax=Sphingobacterium sp. JB170 TaxID=1434842 RepID=UPI000B34B071|nr:amidohydrolase family protein [Sphingobacterium sp. JB170]
MRIDAHQHFWLYDKERDRWITDEMAAIQRNFMPTDLAPLLRASNIDGVVAVQASQSLEETKFLIDLSTMYAMIKAVVGWVDLQADTIEEQLMQFQASSIVKGFRHVIEGEEDPDFLMRPAFLNGIKTLTKYNYTFDLLIRPRHFQSTLSCVSANPNQRFVLDHIAKPNFRDKEFEQWSIFIESLAKYPNVFCKVSGLVTEANWNSWTFTDFVHSVQHVVTCFGKDRLMFGSDWPVCELAAEYSEVIKIAQTAIGDLSALEEDAFWSATAKKFYSF